MATNYQNQGSSLDNNFIPRRLFTQGGLWAFGNNNFGTLGDGSTTSRSSPVQTSVGGITWKKIVGYTTSIGIKSDGSWWSWGDGQNGLLGNSTFGSGTNTSAPVGRVGGYYQISCSAVQAAAIGTNGSLWMWGLAAFGALGNNSSTTKYSSPVQTVGGGLNWRFVSCGFYTTAAIDLNGSLWLWGNNTFGQLGDNTVTHKSSPIQTISGGTNWKFVASGYYSVAAIKTDGSLWLWGRNNYGILGDNTVTHKSSPIQTIAGGTNWKQISVGNALYMGIAGIKTDGSLWLWGRNNYGQLGDNTITDKSSPVQTISGGTNWKVISIGGSAGAIKTDGTLWLWGKNDLGQLGDNTIANKSSPVQTVMGGTSWTNVVSNGINSLGTTDIF